MKYKTELYDLIRHYTIQTEMKKAMLKFEAIGSQNVTPEILAQINQEYKDSLEGINTLESDYSVDKRCKEEVTSVLLQRIKNLITEFCSLDK